MTHSPTPEQEAILQAAQTPAHLMIKAYAGCAKTTSLTMVAQALPGDTRGLALAFNVKIKKELERVFPSNFTVLTLNGLGHRAWGRAIRGKLTLDDRKLGRLITETAKAEKLKLSPDEWDATRTMVSSAMQQGLVPSGLPYRGLVRDDETSWRDLADDAMVNGNAWPLARQVLSNSISEAFRGIVSFDDQIYCSALLGGLFEPYPLVMVDESQDLSPLNHIQVAKASAGGRLIVVGDPKQAIYAFRGADSSSMEKLRSLRKDWTDLPLATTFRCPHVIVGRQQNHAPGFRAWPTNKQGTVVGAGHHDPLAGQGWDWEGVQHIAQGQPTAVLCRNVAPLLSLAFALLRQNVPVVMLGRDIGKGLANLVKKICPIEDTPASACRILITNWMSEEIHAAELADRPSKAEAAQDRGESLLAVLESSGAIDARSLALAIKFLFAQEEGKVTLSTIHRAKGLEWHCVVHLDPWRIPSRQAKKAAALGNMTPLSQEQNLNYVAETRAQDTLLLANLEDFT